MRALRWPLGVVDIVYDGAGQPELELKLNNIPNAGGLLVVKGLSFTFSGTGPSGAPLVYLPSGGCSSPLTVGLTADTYNADSGSGTATINESGCSALPYAPQVTATATRESAR